MKLTKVVRIFVPKDNSFFPLFERAVKNLSIAGESLIQLLKCDDSEIQMEIFKQIKEYEKVGDKITDETFLQLNKSFITPFDREDIHELASDLDDVLDAINGVSSRINYYKPIKLFPVYLDMALVIHKATKEIEISVNHLRNAIDNKNLILKSCEEITRLEQKADEIYYNGISKFFVEEKNMAELVKCKDILEILEKCMDKTDAVAETLKTVLVKLT
jgi:uncharacterized protein